MASSTIEKTASVTEGSEPTRSLVAAPQVTTDTQAAEAAVPIQEKNIEAVAAEYEDFPTEEEIHTLRRVAGKVPLKLYSIAFVELCERFSYYGTVIVVNTNFIQQPLPPGSRTGAGFDGQSGALGMGQRASTGIGTFNTFYQYMMPLFGAYVADEIWGRYKTICVALMMDIIGHLVLIMSAIPPVITRPHENSLGALIVGILVIGFGTGGFKPNISPLIVEQLPLNHMVVRTLKTGERVIEDPTITVNRVYNWFYFFINVGALIGQLSMSFAEKYVGFWLSFTLPTVMLAIAPAVMFWGRRRYDRRPPSGSVLGKVTKLWVLAMKGRWHLNPLRTWRHLHDGTFWESVKPSHLTANGTPRPRWMTFDDAWVDEVARGLAACAVFCYLPIYWLTYNQINNNLVSQAATMKLNGLPNEVVSNLDPFALLILIPVCDFGVYPLLRRFKINFSPIKRIAAGFFTGAAAMIWSTVIQYYIYKQSACGSSASSCDPVGISVWAQSGAYILIALSEIFASITSLEYAFSKAPRSMRSMVQAIALFMSAIAAAIGEGFVTLSEDPLLIWNYGSMAVLAFVAGVLFWVQFRGLDREEDLLNALPEGRMFTDDEESAEDAGVGVKKEVEEKR